jgi:hypothetical protein
MYSTAANMYLRLGPVMPTFSSKLRE